MARRPLLVSVAGWREWARGGDDSARSEEGGAMRSPGKRAGRCIARFVVRSEGAVDAPCDARVRPAADCDDLAPVGCGAHMGGDLNDRRAAGDALQGRLAGGDGLLVCEGLVA